MDVFYNNFPEKWTDGLPVGNGRLAGMLWGKDVDTISLNHEWIWTGQFKNRKNQKSAHFLPHVRDYLKNSDFFRANALAALAFGGNGGISPLPRQMDSFQPAGDIIISVVSEPKKIERQLDMDNGIAYSIKEYEDNKITTSVYCDSCLNFIITLIESDKPTDIHIKFEREKAENTVTQIAYSSEGFYFTANINEGISFAVKTRIQTSDKIIVENTGITIVNSTKVMLITDIATEKRGIEKELSKSKIENTVTKKDFDNHAKKFYAHMSKSDILIYNKNFIDEKFFLNDYVVQLKKENKTDPYLISIYTKFGIYLMVSGSICADLPLHLQGKWNRDLEPKWNSDYHLNINLQMNYWFTDKLGMSEYTKMMLEYILTLLPKARQAAQDLYGCRGILYPLSSDIWANSTAEAYNYAVWIAAAGWFCRHFIDYYICTGDKDFLEKATLPFIRETLQFYEDYFFYDENDKIVIAPSQSPENKFEGGGYFPVSICANAAMDVQIAYEAHEFGIFSKKELNQHDFELEKWETKLEQFPDFHIGSDGRLLEWDNEDKIELEKGHRHVSHLYGVFPGNLFTPETRKLQFEAAKKSLEYRLNHSGGHTGWSRAWAACLFARFLNGKKVNEHLHKLITDLSSTTLLDLHPNYYPQNKRSDNPSLFTEPLANPSMIFQIDGNLGAVAATIESLVQCRDDKIYLLPALDDSWANGYVKNILLPYANTVSFEWKNLKLTKLTVSLGFKGKAIFANLSDCNIKNSIVDSNGCFCVTGKSGESFILMED